MSFLETIRTALESLRVNRFRSLLTALGVIIGVAAIILLVAIGEGAKIYITQQFADLGANLIIVLPGKQETSGGAPMSIPTVHRLTWDDAMAIRKRCPSVVEIAPIVMGAGPVKFRNRRRDTTVIGVTFGFQEVRNLHVEIGSFIPRSNELRSERVCVLGRTVYRELFQGENPLGEFVRVNESRFRVIGVMEEKGRSLGFDIDDIVFVPVGAAMDLFDQPGLFELLVKAESADRVDAAEREVAAILRRRHRGIEDFTVINQGEMLSVFTSVLNILTYVLAGIAAISLVVGGIGIMNIMLVSVTERTREIGIRKALGARDRDLLVQFLVESVVLSVAGGTIGISIGWGGAAALSFVTGGSLPTSVSLWSVALASGFSIATGVFFGVYPARKASRLDPIEALRYE